MTAISTKAGILQRTLFWLKRWRGIATRYAKKHILFPFRFHVWMGLAAAARAQRTEAGWVERAALIARRSA